MSNNNKEYPNNNMMTFGGHLEVLRQMLFRILTMMSIFSIVIFCFKEITFDLILAPSQWNFITYRLIEKLLNFLGTPFAFDEFHVSLIATELSSQFMTHVTTSLYLGFLCSSPYFVYELFRFVSPALYESEKKYSLLLVIIVYLLFLIGVLMSYFVLFPISFRFLGTYSVDVQIKNTITLDSYISTFLTLTLIMGIVFQLPIVSFILGKMSLISSSFLIKYRKHALILIMLMAAIITPPDIMTLILVTIPLYLLYEISIHILKHIEEK